MASRVKAKQKEKKEKKQTCWQMWFENEVLPRGPSEQQSLINQNIILLLIDLDEVVDICANKQPSLSLVD